MLQAVIREEPDNRLAWSLFSSSLSSDDERIEALKQLLKICPGNQRAVKALAFLQASRARAEQREASKKDAGVRNYRVLFGVTLSLFLMGLLYCVVSAVFVVSNNPWQKEVESLSGRYNTLLDQFSGLQEDYNSLSDAHSLLQSQHTALWQDYNNLSDAHSLLQSQHTALRQDYNSLSDAHSLLQSQHAALQQDYSNLLNEYNSLLVQYESLQQDYNALVSEYNWLHSIAVIPPYILVDGRTVHINFFKMDQSIRSWQVSFESLEADIWRGHDARNNWFSQIGSKTKLRDAAGEVFFVTDYRGFVDPNPFREVITELYFEASSEDAFIQEVWNIVTQLSTYSSEIEDTPRYPLETFLAGGGDCEDTSILFASMIKAAPVDWKVDLVYMDLNNPSSPQEINHVMVHINTSSRDYYIETTSDWMMEPFAQVGGWYLEVE